MNTIISKLKEQGCDVSWYEKGAKRRRQEPPAEPTKCSWFSIYLLEGEYAWTKGHNGEPYQKHKKLKTPVEQPSYFCSACGKNWRTFEASLKHLPTEQQALVATGGAA